MNTIAAAIAAAQRTRTSMTPPGVSDASTAGHHSGIPTLFLTPQPLPASTNLLRSRDAGIAHHLAPADDFGFHEFLQLVDAPVFQREKSVLERLLFDFRHRQHGSDLGVELVEDRPRRPRRR